MKIALLVLAAACLPNGCPADLIIVQNVEGGMQQGEQTIRIKDHKVRADIARGVTMFIDALTGETVTLMHNDRTFIRLPLEQMKALTAKTKALQPGEAAVKLQPLGRKEKVGSWDAELFTAKGASIVLTYWIAKDYPNGAEVLAAQQKIQEGALGSLAATLMPKPSDFPGVPVKTEINALGQKITTTLVSVKQEDINASVFEIPKEYKELATPLVDPATGK